MNIWISISIFSAMCIVSTSSLASKEIPICKTQCEISYIPIKTDEDVFERLTDEEANTLLNSTKAILFSNSRSEFEKNISDISKIDQNKSLYIKKTALLLEQILKKNSSLYDLTKNSNDGRDLYNAGVYLYKNHQYEKAIDYFKKSSKRLIKKSISAQGIIHLRKPMPDLLAAHTNFIFCSRFNDPECHYYLGYLYINGIGVKKNPVTGYRFMRRSAQLGDIKALDYLIQHPEIKLY